MLFRSGDGGPTVQVLGDVNGGEYLMDRLAERLETKRRDAALMHQLDSIEVGG